eukprot:3355951-Ditylum_brightwellii.AAC.1
MYYDIFADSISVSDDDDDDDDALDVENLEHNGDGGNGAVIAFLYQHVLGALHQDKWKAAANTICAMLSLSKYKQRKVYK